MRSYTLQEVSKDATTHVCLAAVVGALQNSPHLLIKDYLEERRDGRFSVVSHDRFVERVLALDGLSTLKEYPCS
jgi:hypothetical protein